MANETTEADKGGRRIKRILVSSDFFPMAFRTGLVFQIESGVPANAQFRGYVIDERTNCVAIFIEHESFEFIPYAKEVPILDLKFIKRQAEYI